MQGGIGPSKAPLDDALAHSRHVAPRICITCPLLTSLYLVCFSSVNSPAVIGKTTANLTTRMESLRGFGEAVLVVLVVVFFSGQVDGSLPTKRLIAVTDSDAYKIRYKVGTR